MSALVLDVKSKPQDHMRQFKLRFRDDYLNYFKIYYTYFFRNIHSLWSGGEIAKIFLEKSHCRQHSIFLS